MKELRTNPKAKASMLSIVTFWWMNKFFNRKSCEKLRESDMFDLLEDDTSLAVTTKLERFWKREQSNGRRQPSFMRAMARAHLDGRFKLFGFLLLFEEILRTSIPLFICELIKYFENMMATPAWHAYTYTAAICIASILMVSIHHGVQCELERIGWHMRASAGALIYEKTLRLSQESLAKTSSGKIVNLSATDIMRFDHLPRHLHLLWIGPLQVITIGFILWKEFGNSVFAGLTLFMILQLVQYLVGRALGRLRQMTAVITDERVGLMSEIIAGMRIFKMHTWEKPFARLVSSVRRREISKILLSSSLKAFFVSMYLCHEKLLTFTTLLVHVATAGDIRASNVFKMIGLYNVLRWVFAMQVSMQLQILFESVTSFKRIEDFLLMDETSPPTKNSGARSSENTSFVEISNYHGKWEREGDNATIRDVTVRVEPGMLLAVIGPVGSGKSSFLNAILQELHCVEGTISVHGKIAMTSQVPWVFSDTVRENILFGQPYDPPWYNEVVDACCLQKDFQQLQFGDLTLVGESGVTLSGGQKSRLNLARVIYRRDVSIYMMDDPLSAVDSAVANTIFEKCFQGILKNKIRILVTHQLQFLQRADHIIMFEKGEISDQGAFDELKQKWDDLSFLINTGRDIEVDAVDSHLAIDSLGEPIGQETRVLSVGKTFSKAQVYTVPVEEDGQIIKKQSEEFREKGSIHRKIYSEYFRVAANASLLVIFFLVSIASHVVFVLNDWWLSRWMIAIQIQRNSSKFATAQPEA